MKVQTYLFGEIDVDPDRVITFPEGLIAFENNKRFTLIHEADKENPVSFTLQSLDDPHVAFQIIDPGSLGYAYELALTAEEVEKLQSPSQEEVSVMQILFRQEDNGKQSIGANVRSPLIINTRARIGIQKVIAKPHQNITISNLSSAV